MWYLEWSCPNLNYSISIIVVKEHIKFTAMTSVEMLALVKNSQ